MAKRLKALVENYLEARCEGPSNGYDIRVVQRDNYEHYYILIKPISGVYQGQKYIMEMKTKYGKGVDETTYPTNAPYVHFVTGIFHVNISPNGGSICLDILKDKDKWSPLNSFATLVQNILLLFNEPNNASPYNNIASKAWVECEKEYKLGLEADMTMKQQEELYILAFKPFIKKAILVMRTNNMKKYAEWFPELDEKHPDYKQRLVEYEEELQMLKDMKESFSKKPVSENTAVSSESPVVPSAPKKKRWEKYTKQTNS
jgi:ubiquitin-protein ligase